MKVMLLALVCLAVAAAAPASARVMMPASDGEVAPERVEFEREGGQTPPPAQTPAPSQAPTPPTNYKYSPEGRRDPFISLVNRGTADRPGGRGQVRPEGIAGVMVDEVVVKGIVQTRGGWVAMVGAPNGKTYTVRTGDRLMDGTVRAINAQTVVLLQEVNDPLKLEKQREVHKHLRGEVK